MVETEHRTSTRLGGVWFVDSDSLKKLEEIVSDQFACLESIRKDRIAIEVKKIKRKANEDAKNLPSGDSPDRLENHKKHLDERVRQDIQNLKSQRPWKVSDIRFRLKLRSGSKKTYKSVLAALSDFDLAESIVDSLELRIESGEFEIVLEVNNEFPLGTGKLSASPGTSPESWAAFSRFENWLLENKKHVIYNYWPAAWVAAIYLAMICTIAYFTATESPRHFGLEQARAIVETGVNDKNRDAAIELLLRGLFGFNVREKPAGPGLLRTGLMISAWIAVVALYFWPTTIIGLGKRKDAIKRWNLWIKFLVYFVPALVGLNILPNLVSSYIYDSIKG